MKKEFFAFWPKHLNRELQIEPIMKYYSYKLLEKTDPIISNSKYTIKKGSKQFDIVTYLDWSQFLISEKFKNILDRNGFNGYECFPAEIVGLSSKYYGWLNINEVGPIIRESPRGASGPRARAGRPARPRRRGRRGSPRACSRTGISP